MIWFGALAFLLSGYASWASEIQVRDAWVREAPPSAKALAAYMVISNTGKSVVRLKRADCSAFATVEVHQSMMHKGMMHMMAVGSLEIAPGNSVVLQPGGYHLMLVDPQAKLRVGDQVQIELHFDTGENLAVTAAVKKGAPVMRE
ncbi:MAG: copper chaperone PCu(A)C [Desulfobulbus sp.]|nr:copper chaperone PCu(A)C [Desulfobulbus sp.]